MTQQLAVWVPGLPIPQGSKRALISKGTQRPIVVDSNRIGLADWRAQMTSYIRDEWRLPPEEVSSFGVRMEFVLPRPRAHYWPINSRRNEPVLREDAPRYVPHAPDLDKLQRAVLDSLTNAGVWRDDAQCVYIVASKVYVGSPQPERGPGPGVYITAGRME